VNSIPEVTIGLCVKNRENLVADAIESIARQDFPRDLTEIIVVDDGSTDKTLERIHTSLIKFNLKAKVISQNWKGLGPARNVVLRNSSCKYIIWLDSDMVLSKDFIRNQISFMEKNPDVAVAKGAYGMYSANIVSSLENLEFITTNSKKMRTIDPNALGTGGSIYRTSVLKSVGGFNEKIQGSGEDAEVEYRINKAGWKLDSTSAVFLEKRRSNWRSIWDEYYWHGKGSLQIITGKSETSRYKFFPPFAFLIECIRIVVAYKQVQRKIALLLPVYFVFKRTAWLLGLLHARFLSGSHSK
jgi:glycosyltransferase involved in cell wall biosynthesis